MKRCSCTPKWVAAKLDTRATGSKRTIVVPCFKNENQVHFYDSANRDFLNDSRVLVYQRPLWIVLQDPALKTMLKETCLSSQRFTGRVCSYCEKNETEADPFYQCCEAAIYCNRKCAFNDGLPHLKFCMRKLK